MRVFGIIEQKRAKTRTHEKRKKKNREGVRSSHQTVSISHTRTHTHLPESSTRLNPPLTLLPLHCVAACVAASWEICPIMWSKVSSTSSSSQSSSHDFATSSSNWPLICRIDSVRTEPVREGPPAPPAAGAGSKLLKSANVSSDSLYHADHTVSVEGMASNASVVCITDGFSDALVDAITARKSTRADKKTETRV